MSNGETSGSQVTIDEFRRTELVVAEVLACSPVERSDRLYMLELSLAGETTQIVSGLAEHYKAEELVGKQIILLKNLVPAVIRGVRSNGMLLAAKDGDSFAVLTVDRKVANGSSIS